MIMSKTDYTKPQLISMVEKSVDNVNGLLTPVGAALVLADKLRVNVDDIIYDIYNQEYKLEVKDNMTTISEINDDEYESVTVVGTVKEVSGPYDVTCNKGKKNEYDTKILKINIEDDTGSIWVDIWRPKVDFDEGHEVEVINGYTKYDDYNETYRLGFAPKRGGSIVNRSAKPKKKSSSKKSTTKKSGSASKGGGASKKNGGTSTADVKSLKKYIDKKIKALDESICESIAGAFVKLEDIDEICRNIMKQLKIIVKHGGIPELEDEPEDEPEDEFDEDDELEDGDEPENDEPEDDDDTETDDE